MNAKQKKSLKLIEEFFNTLDGDAFLKEHESLEHNIGPTIEFFLDNLQKNSYSSFVKMKSESVPISKHFEIEERSYSSFDGKRNACYAANDENYPISLPLAA